MTHSRLGLSAAPLILTSIALAACGSSSKSTTTTTTAAAGSPSTLMVTASDYKFAPTSFTAKAGKVRITLKNTGKVVHEFVVLKTGAAPGSLKATGGRVSEKSSVGEVSETKPGATRTATLRLKAGTYDFVCNVPGHYMLGMHGRLTVT